MVSQEVIIKAPSKQPEMSIIGDDYILYHSLTFFILNFRIFRIFFLNQLFLISPIFFA